MHGLFLKINVLNVGKLDTSKLGIVVLVPIVLVQRMLKSLVERLNYIQKGGRHLGDVGFD